MGPTQEMHELEQATGSRGSGPPDTSDVLERVRNMEAVQNRLILEREDVTRAITICLINRSHLLLAGPPGIAKTTQVRLAAAHLRGSRFFYTQLTPFSTIEDIFGPVDILAYKHGERRRVSTHMLQEAHVAVVDEIYNGNEAVLKALLAPMYEGVYAEQGRFHPIPLRTLMGTTNAIPGPEERREKGLTGFHDRWLFRFVVDDLQSDASFMRMLWTPDIDFRTYAPDARATVTIEELDHLASLSAQVRVPVSVYEELARLRRAMQAEALYCSPRRWKQIRRALQTSALLSGRNDVSERDFGILRHMLWDQPEDIPVLERLLEDYLRAVKERAAVKFSRILEICGEFEERRRSAQSPADVSKLALGARQRVEERIRELKELSRQSVTETDQMAVEQYLQRAYDRLRELDEAAGL
ncbi:MAG: AAA family ATPase [Firmicutes bacterium]|nr:AAA family ATPase [Bacillota bacterium]